MVFAGCDWRMLLSLGWAAEKELASLALGSTLHGFQKGRLVYGCC